MIKTLFKPILALLKLCLAPLGFGLKSEFDQQLQQARAEFEVKLNERTAELAHQISEDIQGPLAALTTLSHLSHDLSADNKDLLKVTVTRLRGISESLSGEKKAADLVLLLQDLAQEFKYSHVQTEWSFHNHLTSAEVPVNMDELQLQRLLSSLLTHAAINTQDKAIVEVTLMERAEQVILQIMDNGDITTNQEDVLIAAKKSMELIGGDMQIRSREAVGTQVILIFPKVDVDTVEDTYLPADRRAKF